MKKDWLKISGMHDGATPKIFRNAARLRVDMTEPEKLLWESLKTKPFGFKFRRQHPIKFFILDFYCHKKRLSIEIDGGYHNNPEQKEKDKVKTAYLKSVDIKEIRFKNDEVINDINKVIEIIKTELCVGSL
jgi:very-short-patch-repair endonuclease